MAKESIQWEKKLIERQGEPSVLNSDFLPQTKGRFKMQTVRSYEPSRFSDKLLSQVYELIAPSIKVYPVTDENLNHQLKEEQSNII